MSEQTREMSTREVRASLADVVNQAATRGQITYITSRGRRIAAVVPIAVAEAAERAAIDKRSAES